MRKPWVEEATGRRFFVTAFEGARKLSVLRAAAGSARFLIAGASCAGRVDQILVTLAEMSVTTEPPDAQTSPRVVPIVVRDNTVLLQPSRPLVLVAGETHSLVVPHRLGVDAVLTKNGVLALRPALTAEQLLTPTPENYLNGAETLTTGPTQTFPELVIQIVRAKALEPTAGTVRDVTLRTDTGAPVSFSDLRNQNEALWRSRHGSLNPALVQRLASLPSTGLVLADVWMHVPGAPPTLVTDARTPEAWDLAHAAFVEARRAAAAPVAAALSAELTAAGAAVVDVDLHPPVLHIQASREVLESTAALLTDALEVAETPSERTVLTTNGAVDLVQEPLFLAHLLLGGQNLRIALVEPDACVATEHEAFRGVFFEEPVGPCSSRGTLALDGHSTRVAGALAAFVPETSPGSPNTTRPPGGLVGLFQGRLFTADTCGVDSRILARNPHLVNLSCLSAHTPAGEGRADLDSAVFADRVFVAKGSGNDEDDNPDLLAFCHSYNAVCVGGYNLNLTFGPSEFGDDSPAGLWVNDPATGREKPDLVGPYTAKLPLAHGLAGSFNYPNATYDSSYTGTSFSTPFVVGTAALLMANYPQHLINDPTLTRAVLMASAHHSLQGFPTVPIISDTIDDRAGAGAPRGDRAREILKNHQFFSGYIDRNVDFDAAGDLEIPDEFVGPYFNAGDKVRVVLTYDQCPFTSILDPDALVADLDLVVQGSPQALANNSHVDNTEIVAFTALGSGNAVVRVHVQHWDPCTDGTRKTHLAIAWDVLPASEP